MSTGAILITGAAKRIGRQLALDLAAAGHDIAIHFNESSREAEEVAYAWREPSAARARASRSIGTPGRLGSGFAMPSYPPCAVP